MKRTIPIITALALALAACGGDDDPSDASEATAEATAGAETSSAAPESSTTPSESSSQVAAAAFPVTIEHKYGETTIEAEPQRVVSVGFADQDWLLALGVTPIGIREWYGDFPSATWPWASDELGDAQPAVLPSAELNFEQIAALDPDLIVGVGSGMTETDYATLAQIAPTLAQPSAYIDYGTPWDVTTEMIGKAVGRSDEATAVIERVEGLYAAAREAHPEFGGATAAVAFYFEDMPGAYASEDSRARLLGDLGFVTPPRFDEIAGDAFYFSVSNEEIGELDSDVIVWVVGSEADLPNIANMPTRPSLTAYAEGREVITDPLVSGAFSFASPLSIEYLLENLVPELALAVDGDPATVVPSAQELLGLEGSEPSGDGSSAAAPEFDADQQAAAAAWALAFDSSVGFADKSAHVENAAALQATIDNYVSIGDAMGGVTLAPTNVVIDGETATVTYDVMFGDTAAYEDVEGSINLVDGVWIVPRAEFCGFMAQAQNPCPA